MSDPKLPATRPPVRSSGTDLEPIKGANTIAGLSPFGLGREKPHHIKEMAEVVWENRDNLAYAWRILNQGVCDGCSLGPRGLRDDVIDGIHLCTSRLKLLRINTMPSLTPADLMDMERLRSMTNRQLQALGRLPYPFIYRPGDRGFSRISWDEALDTLAQELGDSPPERLGFFASSKGITNESYYTFTKSARLLGTNHVDLCARLCHAATVSGLKATIGVGAPTVSLSDMIGTDLLLLVGTNISNNQPVTMKYLVEAKKKGTRVVVVNTTMEKGLANYWVPSMPVSAVFGTKLMDDFIQVKAGGDIAFLNGVLKAVIERGAQDQAYIDAHTKGFDDLSAELQAQSWDDLEEVSGVRRAEIEWVAELFCRARTAVTIYSMGLTQYEYGVQNVEAVVNLHLSRGMIGRPKAGILPIRGHSGVQGGGECGVSPSSFPGLRGVNPDTAATMSALWGGHPVPSWKGYHTGHLIEGCERGEFDLLYNMGGNFLGTMPDPRFVVEAMKNVPVRVHQDIVVNTSTLLEPGKMIILLPAQTRYEQRGGGTSTSTERRIRFSPEVSDHPKVGECKPEWEIPCLVASRIRPALKEELHYPCSSDIREEMDRTMPVYKGISTLKKAGDWIQWGGPQLCRDGDFGNMPGGKAHFAPSPLPDNSVPEGKFYLTTRRGKQFNSIIIKDIDHLQGGRDRDDLFMAETDCRALSVADGDRVSVTSDQGAWEARVRVMDIKAGTVQAYWPECNGLISRCYDPRSGEPHYNAIVGIEKIR